jgi:acyl-CoA synthetase (AMP-forming)/AMP-acid ligase II
MTLATELRQPSSLEANLVRRVNVADLLRRTAARLPAHLAVVDGDRRLSYAELDAAVNRLAHALWREGFRRGDALALVSGNSLEFLETYFACARLGVVCVPVNLGWGPKEIAYVLGHSGSKGLVVEAAFLERTAPALEGIASLEEVVVVPGLAGEEGPPADGRRWLGFDDLVEGAPTSPVEVVVEDRDPVSYLYTSGTTSAPKGVVSSHLAVYLESMAAALEMGLRPSDRTAAMMPMFHTAQLNGFVTPFVTVGGSVVVMRGFEPGLLLELIERERITHIFGLPMMYRALLEHPDLARRDHSSLRRAVYAMAPMPDEDLRRAMEVFGCEFSLGFGQTEMNPLTTVFRPEDQLRYPGSVGTQIVNVEVAIMDDEGNLLPAGSSGEIVYRGPHAMEGYLHDPEATAAAFAGGWFHSGDVGRFDEHGVLWFEDRKKDVIKTGGENVASLEVERALYDAEPRIAEVAVVGLPHPRWGEAVTAVVIPRPGEPLTEAEVLAKAKERLASFKVPKAVVLRDDLPRTATGKIQKHLLRQELADLYEKPDA